MQKHMKLTQRRIINGEWFNTRITENITKSTNPHFLPTSL